MNEPSEHVYEFGDLRLDAAKRLLWRQGAPVPLTPRVFETLLYMVEHHGTVLDKERLMKAIWPDSIVEENNLVQNISALRRVFGETPGSHRFIVTVPGRGYRFVADVRTCGNGFGFIEQAETSTSVVKAEDQIESNPAVLPPTSVRNRNSRPVFLAVLTFFVLGLGALFFLRGGAQHPVESPALLVGPPMSIPGKSIAVLPFENLSSDIENSYFAAGLQEDVLTSLAQIHELKVISRTSVMGYQQTVGRNMREIGQALGVASLLEGSVRRVGNRVLVSVQLIDARNDLHLWAERYDRTVADSIGLQGELATQIATALRARLAPEEEASLQEKPTDNPEAYALYLQARGTEDRSAAERLYARAIALDPKFALACARRSILNSQLAYYDASPQARRAEARTEAEAALRLSPSLPEAHTALGLAMYWGEKDYAAALKEFSIAAATSPNEPEALTYIAGIYRRQGRWHESLAAFHRAQDLDPRNTYVLFGTALNHLLVRDWPGARVGYTRVLNVNPNSTPSKVGLAYLELFQHSDPTAGRNILRSIVPGVSFDEVTEARWDLAMLDRDYAAAENILAGSGLESFPNNPSPMTFYQGRTALARGESELAQRYFEAARPSIEKWARIDPADPERHAFLALLFAYMHRSEDAVREGRRAVELEPESQDAFHGALWATHLALVYALVGEQDQAITLIKRLLSTPGAVSWPDCPSSLTLADLRLRWEWDSLRGDPRFQKILAGPEPKTVLSTAQPTASATLEN